MILFSMIGIGLVLGILIFLLFPIYKSLSNEKEKMLFHKTALVLTFLIPSVAFILYLQIGTPEALIASNSNPTEEQMSSHESEQLEGLVTQLAQRLEQDPQNAEGWSLLARSYVALGYMVEAKEAFVKAIQLNPEDSQLKADYSKIESVSPSTKGDGNASQISGTVSLDPKLTSKFEPNDTVFIFAKAPQGPKMPIAILRLSAKELPAQFLLDDTLAMLPNQKLSDFSEVLVEARITKSGNPLPQPGDLQGQSPIVKVGSNDVNVVINQIVQ